MDFTEYRKRGKWGYVAVNTLLAYLLLEMVLQNNDDTYCVKDYFIHYLQLYTLGHIFSFLCLYGDLK